MRETIISSFLLSVLTVLLEYGGGTFVEAQQPPILTCVYASWASYRKLPGRVMGDELPAQICTHAIYLYASMLNNTLVSFDSYNDLSGRGQRGNYEKFAQLKTRNSKLRNLIGVGGWNAGGFMFSQMAMKNATRKTFIDSVITFCKTYNFDGLLIDWLVPGVGTRGGDPDDYANFPILLKEMKAAFKKEATGRSEDLLIGITISADISNIDYYDVDNLNAGVDVFYLLAYDFYGPWSHVTYHHSPLFNQPGNYSVDTALQGWFKTNINKAKLALAVTTMARSYAIPVEDNDDTTKIGVKILGDGRAGPLTAANGTLSYTEVCRMLTASTFTVIKDPVAKVPHAYSYDGDLWLSFENEQSVKDKASYVQSQKLGSGIMLFSSDQDDPHGYCGTPYPLSRAARSVLAPLPATEDQAFISDMNSRVDALCFSKTQANCEVTLRCPKFSPAAFASGELECAQGQNCTFPTSVLECVLPSGFSSARDKSFYIQSTTTTPAAYTQVTCRTDGATKSDSSAGKYFVCDTTGFASLESVRQYICPVGYRLRGAGPVCILE